MREMGKRTSDISIDRRHHQPDRRADQSAVAERLDRGGARRRRRPRLRGRRRGDPQPRRPLGEGDRRTSPASSRRCRKSSQDAVGARTTACASPTRATRLPRPARRAARRSWPASARSPAWSAQIARATDEQRHGGQTVVDAPSPRRPSRPGWSPRRPPSRRPPRRASSRRPAQMRKIAQEVTKAVAEQGRAARDILKAAQNTTQARRSQVRKASAEQAKSAAEITQAADSMRRGAATTRAGLAEQAAATDQIAKAAESLTQQMVASVARRWPSRRRRSTQISRGGRSMRQESDQAAKALTEQARGDEGDDRGRGATRRSQIKLITRANREHSGVAGALLEQLTEVRRITDRNAAGVKETRGNDRRSAATTPRPLTAIVERRARPPPNGAPAATARADAGWPHRRRTSASSRPTRRWSSRAGTTGSPPRPASPPPTRAAGRSTTSCPIWRRAGCCAYFHEVLATGAVQVLAPAFHHYLIPCPPRVAVAAFDRMQQRVAIGALREDDRIVGAMVTIEDVTARLEAERDARRGAAQRRSRCRASAPPRRWPGSRPIDAASGRCGRCSPTTTGRCAGPRVERAGAARRRAFVAALIDSAARRASQLQRAQQRAAAAVADRRRRHRRR